LFPCINDLSWSRIRDLGRRVHYILIKYACKDKAILTPYLYTCRPQKSNRRILSSTIGGSRNLHAFIQSMFIVQHSSICSKGQHWSVECTSSETYV
jgi:hypothetical protein